MRINNTDDEAEIINMPYAVVLSQDCDVELDFKNKEKEKELLKSFDPQTSPDKFRTIHDKFLPTILVCPAYNASEFFTGSHVDGWCMKSNSTGEIEKIKSNNTQNRYHYLPQDADIGITDLVIDFKHFFTISTDILYEQRKRSYFVTISEMFRENLSQRFTNYLSRFGLPELPIK